MGRIQLPTAVRFMSSGEYRIVSRVFSDTLPFRVRILITNAAGENGRPFTIPTSLISTILRLNPVTFLANATVGYLQSFVNLGYLINMGEAYRPETCSDLPTLVHETAHVWQGHNSTFALSYVFDSIFHQCMMTDAYNYEPLGRPWSRYNVEQQAHIVEDWYTAGMPEHGSLWPYIRNHVRTGGA